jgi:lysozyme family protein
MSLFDDAFRDLILVEGGYANDPKDRGGRTMYGITEAVARAHGYRGEMRDLNLATAKAIYKRAYWDAIRLDQVAEIASGVAVELFDTGVNMGVRVAVRFLQVALNALNREGRDYPDVDVDGSLGPGTLGALRSYVRVRGNEGKTVLLRALNGMQCARYIQIASTDPTQERFVYGWIKHRVA